jgi:hypothetical protein
MYLWNAKFAKNVPNLKSDICTYNVLTFEKKNTSSLYLVFTVGGGFFLLFIYTDKKKTSPTVKSISY